MHVAYQPKRLESPRDNPPVARAFAYLYLRARLVLILSSHLSARLVLILSSHLSARLVLILSSHLRARLEHPQHGGNAQYRSGGVGRAPQAAVICAHDKEIHGIG
jgi:hypothetical protein